MAELQLKNSTTSTAYTEIDGKKQKVVMIAHPHGTLQLPNSPTDNTGYIITSAGKKHKVLLVYNVGTQESEATSVDIEHLHNATSVLSTTAELATDLGQTTVVMLDELNAMEIDGRSSYKEPGATVYAEDGTTAIISHVDTENETATLVTVASPAATGVDVIKTPESGNPSYEIDLPGNMVIIGGIHTINTLGPQIADNDIFIQLPRTLAHANYVPKITVITATGAFEEIAADVGIRETTGFYICVRNNETTTVNNIQIAWEITGKRA